MFVSPSPKTTAMPINQWKDSAVGDVLHIWGINSLETGQNLQSSIQNKTTG